MISTIISAVVSLFGALFGAWLKSKEPTPEQTATKDANEVTAASATVADNARAAAQEKELANSNSTDALAGRVAASGGVQSGADELNAAIGDANRSAH